MYPLHRAYVRFYPTLLVALTIAQRALAFDGGSAEGDPAATEEAPKLDVIADEFAIPGEPFRFEVGRGSRCARSTRTSSASGAKRAATSR